MVHACGRAGVDHGHDPCGQVLHIVGRVDEHLGEVAERGGGAARYVRYGDRVFGRERKAKASQCVAEYLK